MVTIIFAVMLLAAAAPQQPVSTAPVIAVAAPGTMQELELIDGSRLIGRVETIGEGSFTFRTTGGVAMEVETTMVRSLGIVTGRIVKGELWPTDSNPTRLFFAPTGRSLKRGEGYFGVYEIMLPFVQVGITDRFSFGGGTPLVFGGGGDRPFWITPKLQVASGKSAAASVGVLHFLNIGEASVGIAYGVVTTGSTDRAASIGVGYAYARADDEGGGAPVLMVGGEHRLSRRLKFVTENYVFNGGGFVSGGFRLLGERLSADIGLVAPLFQGGMTVVFPMINFVWKF